MSKKPSAIVDPRDVEGQVFTEVDLIADVKNSHTDAPMSGVSVEFFVDDVYVGSDLSNASGVARIPYQIPLGPSGFDSITGRTSETSTHLGNEGFGSLSKLAHVPLITTYDRLNIPVGQLVDLHAWLRHQDGSPIEGRTIQFKVAGVPVGSAVTEADGHAHGSRVNNMDAGTYALGAHCSSNSTYAAVEDEATFSSIKSATALVAADVSGTIGQSANLSATLTRNHDGALLENETITFTVAGVSAGSGVTNASGVATSTFTVPVGVLGPIINTIQANFAETPRHLASSDTATLTRFADTVITPSNVNGERLQVRNLSAVLRRAHDNLPLNGKSVKFEVDAVLVGNAVTSATGTATIGYLIPGSMTVGNHAIKTTFLAEPAAYLNGGVGSSTLSVDKWATEVTVSNSSGTAGETVNLSGVVRRTLDNVGVASGSAEFLVQGVLVGTDTTPGIGGSYQLPWVVSYGLLGVRTLTINYLGNADYLGSSNTGTFTRTGKTLTGTIDLQDWTAPSLGRQAHIEIYDGSGNLRDAFNVTLGIGGVWTRSNSPVSTGPHLVYAKVWHWLNKMTTWNITTSGATGIPHSLVNGDVDEDNEVGPGDFGALTAAFGSVDGDGNWNAAAVLDGDGEVGPSDFAILSANFGLSGD